MIIRQSAPTPGANGRTAHKRQVLPAPIGGKLPVFIRVHWRSFAAENQLCFARMSEPVTQRRCPPLWRNVSFTLMWTSTAASGFGDRMIMLAALALLGGLAKNAESSSGVYAATQFFFLLPYILVSAPAGWLADRMPRKYLLLACDQFRGLILLLSYFLIASATGPAQIPASHHWKVYTALLAVGVFAATFSPTRNAIVPQIVPLRQLPGANALILGITTIASLIGILAGPLLIRADQASSVRLGLLVAALFYIVSGTFFAFMQPVEHHAATSLSQGQRRQARSLRVAVGYCLAHRRILALIGVSILIWSSSAIVSSAPLGIGRTYYHLDGDELNVFNSIALATLGAGMLIGALLIGLMSLRREAPLVMFASIVAAGLCVCAMAVVRSPWITYLACFGVGLFGNFTIVTSTTLLQNISADYVRGRVMGVASMTNTAFSVATYLVIMLTPDSDRIIIRAALVLGAILAVIGLAGLARYLVSGSFPNAMANLIHHFNRLYCFVWHRLEIRGRANIPSTGPVVLCANHTTGLDPFLMQVGCLRLVRWLMLTEYLFTLATPLWRAINPVALDKNGSDLGKIKQIVAILKSGDIVGLFPEGELQRKVRVLAPFRPGIGMIAKRSGAAIVPVWIEGTPRKHHMLWHFLWPSRSSVTFGKPFTPDPDADHEVTAVELRRRMLALAPAEAAVAASRATRSEDAAAEKE
jgi:1-acyl-sn-glycerol-3-phosphate acyltransferase